MKKWVGVSLGKARVVGVVPIVVAAPVSVEVEIGDVIVPLFVAESLTEDGGELRRYFMISGGVRILSVGGDARGHLFLRDRFERPDELEENAGEQGGL
jgi:hypothetical protein